MPTWVIALVVVAALGGSAWLFLRSPSSDAPTDTTTTQPREEAADESADVLSLPDDEEPTDERRRGEEGRDRLDADVDDGAAGSDDHTTDGTDGTKTGAGRLPAAYASLRERRIALLAASSEGTGDASRLVRVQGLRVPCATPGPRNALALELAGLALLSERLSAANATVIGTRSDRFGAATCVDARVATLKDADVALVLRVAPSSEQPRVIVGRPTGSPDTSSTALAAEVAASLDLAAVTPSRAAATRTLLANTGAIDSPKGASVVLVELPATALVEAGSLEIIVDDLVGAIAAHLSRADQQGD